MILENSLNLPQPIVDAIRNDRYDSGGVMYSTTTLIRPARIVALSRQHREHLVEDVSDRIFALIGQAIHGILERASGDDYIVERRYKADFDGITIGGQIDVFSTKDGMLSDYKLTSRYSIADGVKEEWQAQASINRLLMHRNGIEVKGAQIVALLRDWSKMEAGRKSDYPPRQVAVLRVPLWPLAQTEQFIRARIAAHESAKLELPMCSPEERWERPTRYALMQKGRKRAVKLYEDQDEAIEAVSGREGFFVETRPGESVRCLNYCPVVAYCSFGRALLEEKME